MFLLEKQKSQAEWNSRNYENKNFSVGGTNTIQ